MKKNQVRGPVALAILFVAYTIIVFTVPFIKNSVFALSYIFSVVAFAAQIYVFRIAFHGVETAKSRFYGFPIARLGIIYLAVQLILSIVAMALASIIPVWIAVIVYVLLLAVGCIGFIAADAARDEVERQDVIIEKDTSFIKSIRQRLAEIISVCRDKDLLLQLQKLEEDARYSDPVSVPEISETEHELDAAIEELRCAVSENDSAASAMCEKVRKMLSVRNQLCKNAKHS